MFLCNCSIDLQKPSGESKESTDNIAVASAISSIVGVLFLALLVFFVCRNKHQKRTRTTSSVENNDQNPVYGMYYFADGEHIDYETAEVQDENEYYGS